MAGFYILFLSELFLGVYEFFIAWSPFAHFYILFIFLFYL